MDRTFISNNRFYKVFSDQDVFDQSLENSIEAARIAEVSSKFKVPRILKASKKEKEICFEFLGDYQQVSNILRTFDFKGINLDTLCNLFFDIGVGLAEYHIQSKKIHGDFDPTNVLYSSNMDLVYIDFSQPKHFPDEAYNRGSIYRDLALMYIYINTKYPLQKINYAFRRTNKKLSLAFFKGYFYTRQDVRYNETEFKREFDEYLDQSYLSKNLVTMLFRSTRIFNYDELLDVK